MENTGHDLIRLHSSFTDCGYWLEIEPGGGKRGGRAKSRLKNKSGRSATLAASQLNRQ
jgi:hypothetical protein